MLKTKNYHSIKKWLLLLGIATALMASAICVHLYKRLSFAQLHKNLMVNELPQRDGLTIGIIGDSWVSYGKLDSLLATALQSTGIKAKIISAGRDGARSKQILEWLMADDGNAFNYLLQQQPQYCIVVAGINDAQSYVGANNYAHHMGLIVELLHRYHIQPVVVALPWFDTEAAQKNIGQPRKWRNKLSRVINNEPYDNIALYRLALQKHLQNAKGMEPIPMISFDSLCNNAIACLSLYIDALHLNTKGGEKFVNQLANALAAQLKKN